MKHTSGMASNRRFILFGAWSVWLLFLGSFLMPVTKDAQLAGWQAFGFYLSVLWDVKDFWQQVARTPTSILISIFPSTNGAMFVAPWVLWRWPRLSGWLGLALVMGGLVPVVGFFKMMVENQLSAGYYCWVASIFLMAGVCFLRARNAKMEASQSRAQ